ncbi:ribose transport system ATP-binding protein [Sporobacter termitidis DSM 10068]|uniref:Ribose transport system ATP-binding protein n=1 Tax=Sporobacter termitidis DSM 10068 TaxID=1123282 RepID=A0A1M5WK79_9FIRM|nr:sugar ABC transporter ATP-binding protein [Sporobacter termitidis]SHH87881.1 ribose transport system ATP-binding protein [Sporobacter termitidis DSM 10068]
MSAETILEIKGLHKYFGPTHANKNVNLTLRKGEIKGLIGENGSGKSTLLSQIAGIYKYDAGEMILNGKAYAPASPLEANNGKIAMVTQELGVVDKLPVGINIFLGRLNRFSSRGAVNVKKLTKTAARVFEEWNLPPVPLGAMMTGMMIEQRKIVELARALSIEPDILLLDEITQSLSLNNRNNLYGLMSKLKQMGKSVIVITHDIEEMLAISDSITVLRDGAVVGDVKTSETTADKIRYMMVGRDISGDYYRADHKPDYSDEVVLRADNITVSGELEDISFDVHKGEILGFCGLSDSGIHSIGKTVYGLSKLKSGSVRLGGGEEIKNAPDALRCNMAYVPKDRDNEALMIHASIQENCTLPSLDKLKGTSGLISPANLKRLSAETVDKLSIKCTGINQSMDALSGGNKQKVNLGRWLAKDLKVLVLDCPTRGVDVGVKRYIYSLMKQAKADGIATILISDELTEVLGMADRLIVMKDGRMSKTIRRDEEFTEHSVIEVMI